MSVFDTLEESGDEMSGGKMWLFLLCLGLNCFLFAVEQEDKCKEMYFLYELYDKFANRCDLSFLYCENVICTELDL